MVLMTSITYPVVVDGRTVGVIGADLALDDIATRLNALKPFDDGRAMLVSPKGLWVSHPDAAMRMKAYADPGLDVVRKAMADGRPAVVEGVKIKGRPAQRLVAPVRLASGATWAMVVDVTEDALMAPARKLALGLAIGGLVMLLAALGVLAVASRRLIARPLLGLRETLRRPGRAPLRPAGGRDRARRRNRGHRPGAGDPAGRAGAAPRPCATSRTPCAAPPTPTATAPPP